MSTPKLFACCADVDDWKRIVGYEVVHESLGSGIIHGIRYGYMDAIYIEIQFLNISSNQQGKKYEFNQKEFANRFTHLKIHESFRTELFLRRTESLENESQLSRYGKARKLFSQVLDMALSLDGKTRFATPDLDQLDLQLAWKWIDSDHAKFSQSPEKLSTEILSGPPFGRDYELGRVLSARAAEKVAMELYRQSGLPVEDISIQQIENPTNSGWKLYDIIVGNRPIDVKNARRSLNSKDNYKEHCVPRFKKDREFREVTISGFLSEYLRPCELLGEGTGRISKKEVLFLGEFSSSVLRLIKGEFETSRLLQIHFEESSRNSSHFIPPWMFDYPSYMYALRDSKIDGLRDLLSNFKLIVSSPPNANLLPICAITRNVPERLGLPALKGWGANFFKALSRRIRMYGLTMPIVFLTILNHFLEMVISPDNEDYEPKKYSKFLFNGCPNAPLGIFDPLLCIDSLVKTLCTLWEAQDAEIRNFRIFRLSGPNILLAKRNHDDVQWTTLIAYCGGHIKRGEREGVTCGKNPLVFGKSQHCPNCRKLICPDCDFCSRGCSRCAPDPYAGEDETVLDT